MSGRTIDLDFDLLDRQIVGSDGRSAGKVDDVELEFPVDGGAPYVVALHSGNGSLASRLTRHFGPWLERVAQRLTGEEAPNEVSFGIVKRVETHIEVTLPSSELPSDRLDAFFRDTIIRRIPGARHAPE